MDKKKRDVHRDVLVIDPQSIYVNEKLRSPANLLVHRGSATSDMQNCPPPYAAHEYKAVAAVTTKTARTLVRATINLCCRMLADMRLRS